MIASLIRQVKVSAVVSAVSYKPRKLSCVSDVSSKTYRKHIDTCSLKLTSVASSTVRVKKELGLTASIFFIVQNGPITEVFRFGLVR